MKDCLKNLIHIKTTSGNGYPPGGDLGGILSGVNMDTLEVGSFTEGKYMLQLDIWDKILKKKWNFINVYGAAKEENKTEFLAELARFCANNKEPFLLGGDFNINRFASEKNKNTGVRRHSDFLILSLPHKN